MIGGLRHEPRPASKEATMNQRIDIGKLMAMGCFTMSMLIVLAIIVS